MKCSGALPPGESPDITPDGERSAVSIAIALHLSPGRDPGALTLAQERMMKKLVWVFAAIAAASGLAACGGGGGGSAAPSVATPPSANAAPRTVHCNSCTAPQLQAFGNAAAEANEGDDIVVTLMLTQAEYDEITAWLERGGNIGNAPSALCNDLVYQVRTDAPAGSDDATHHSKFADTERWTIIRNGATLFADSRQLHGAHLAGGFSSVTAASTSTGNDTQIFIDFNGDGAITEDDFIDNQATRRASWESFRNQRSVETEDRTIINFGITPTVIANVQRDGSTTSTRNQLIRLTRDFTYTKRIPSSAPVTHTVSRSDSQHFIDINNDGFITVADFFGIQASRRMAWEILRKQGSVESRDRTIIAFRITQTVISTSPTATGTSITSNQIIRLTRDFTYTYRAPYTTAQRIQQQHNSRHRALQSAYRAGDVIRILEQGGAANALPVGDYRIITDKNGKQRLAQAISLPNGNSANNCNAAAIARQYYIAENGDNAWKTKRGFAFNMRGILADNAIIQTDNFLFAHSNNLRDLQVEFRATPLTLGGVGIYADSGFRWNNNGETQAHYGKLMGVYPLLNLDDTAASTPLEFYGSASTGKVHSNFYEDSRLQGFAAGVFIRRLLRHDDEWHIRLRQPLAAEEIAAWQFAIDNRIPTDDNTGMLSIGYRRDLHTGADKAICQWRIKF